MSSIGLDLEVAERAGPNWRPVVELEGLGRGRRQSDFPPDALAAFGRLDGHGVDHVAGLDARPGPRASRAVTATTWVEIGIAQAQPGTSSVAGPAGRSVHGGVSSGVTVRVSVLRPPSAAAARPRRSSACPRSRSRWLGQPHRVEVVAAVDLDDPVPLAEAGLLGGRAGLDGADRLDGQPQPEVDELRSAAASARDAPATGPSSPDGGRSPLDDVPDRPIEVRGQEPLVLLDGSPAASAPCPTGPAAARVSTKSSGLDRLEPGIGRRIGHPGRGQEGADLEPVGRDDPDGRMVVLGLADAAGCPSRSARRGRAAGRRSGGPGP